jgi:hypothetical protein
MTVDEILRDAEKLNWTGYSISSDGSSAQNAGPVAQNTGIAAVGPGPGVSPQVSHAEGSDVDALASVSELLGARS